jgi:hypothetical protein
MKKINLFNEIFITQKSLLLQAINSSNIFGIDIYGKIKYEPFVDSDIFIYKSKPKITNDFEKILGTNYQVVEDANRVLIKAFSNWQEIININMKNSSYDDTTADGVAEFSNKELEEIGWHACEFNIKYRTLVELLEKKCEGTLLCIEQENPYQFSGLGFLSDNIETKRVLFDFCQQKIKEMLKNGSDYKKEDLDDDEEKAAKFFKVI